MEYGSKPSWFSETEATKSPFMEGYRAGLLARKSNNTTTEEAHKKRLDFVFEWLEGHNFTWAVDKIRGELSVIIPTTEEENTTIKDEARMSPMLAFDRYMRGDMDWHRLVDIMEREGVESFSLSADSEMVEIHRKEDSRHYLPEQTEKEIEDLIAVDESNEKEQTEDERQDATTLFNEMGW